MYLDRTGCAWRYLPADFPPWQTVYCYFAAWRDDGTLARLHDRAARPGPDRGRAHAQPTAAVIDSQSVRAADTVPRASRGWDAAKKVNGRKRHIAVDTIGPGAGRGDHRRLRPGPPGRPAAAVEHPPRLPPRPPGLGRRRLHRQARHLGRDTEDDPADRRQARPHAFEVLPRRWVVERTFAWISKHRRTVRDYEHLPASHEAMILWAMIALMTRRLARHRFIRRSLSLPFNLRVRAWLEACVLFWWFSPRRGGVRGGGSSILAGGRGRACRVSVHRPAGQGRADVPKPAADPGRGEPPGRGGPFPGQAQVSGQRAGEAELGVGGDDQPGPPVRGVRGRGSSGRSSRGPA